MNLLHAYLRSSLLLVPISGNSNKRRYLDRPHGSAVGAKGRHLSVCDCLLEEVVLDDRSMLAIATEISRHSTSSVRCKDSKGTAVAATIIMYLSNDS